MEPSEDEQIASLASDLFARRSSGIFVPLARAQIGEWQPQEHYCHDNVETWVRYSPSDEHLRGFLLFDYAYCLPYVQFTPHSVVRRAEGNLADITPSRASQLYPFIEHVGSIELFAEAGKRMNIYHQYR
jgi:hypothetical protein